MAAAAAVLAVVLFFDERENARYRQEQREQRQEELAGARDRLELALTERFFLPRGLASVVALRPDMEQRPFARLAKRMLALAPGAHCLGLARDGGRFTHLYPQDPEKMRNGVPDEVLRRLRSGGTPVLYGPTPMGDLEQALAGYWPVLVTEPEGGREVFWGVAVVISRLESVLADADLFGTPGTFASVLYRSTGEGRDVLFGEPGVLRMDPVVAEISLPGQTWYLASVPRAGWAGTAPIAEPLRTGGVVLALFAGLLVGVFVDRPARLEAAVVRATAAQRLSEARLAELIENTPDGMVVVSDDGTIRQVNNQTEQLFGYSRWELVGRPVEVLVPERFRVRHERHRSGFVADPKRRPMGEGLELLGQRKDGTEFPLEISLSPFRSDQGLLVTATIRDVTERRRAEEELREALHRAEEGEQLKDAFLVNMSHEVRTPLNVITGYAELVKEQLAEFGAAPLREHMEGIERAARRLTTTIHGILDFSKIESGAFRARPVQVDLGEMVREVVEEFRPLAEEKGLEIHCDVRTRATIRFDEYCLARVLEGLVDNAVKFTSAGEVSVAVFEDEDGALQLEVRDTGVGIDERFRARVFEPFLQEEYGYTRKFEGSGLGLALVRRYLELNGASIGLDSAKNRGTTFRIFFDPEAVERVGESVGAGGGQPSPVERQSPNGRPKILVVEDDGETQAFLRVLLRDRYELVFAASAADARDALRQEGNGRIRMILMDVSLRGEEDGLELTRWLRRQDRWKDIPIAVTTAHALVEDRQNALAAGCDRYLPKPIGRQRLLTVIDELLDRPAA